MNSFFSNYKKLAIILLSLGWAFNVSAQDTASRIIIGNVQDVTNLSEISKATITSADGKYTAITDSKGRFSMELPKNYTYIIVQAEDYTTDTLDLNDPGTTPPYYVYLTTTAETLDGVNYSSKVNSTEISTMGVQKMEVIGSKELLKAACCNLSESFETTPSVDVGFTDAVSGYKQIQMLGLTGSHTLFTRENIPDVRGLAAITGLTFTPGTFVESMQLSKGTGSVVNGFEGTAGQINVEWIKPFNEKVPTWALNGYQNVQGRSEGNLIYSKEVNKDLSTNLFLHAKSNWLNLDQNSDGFLDQPKGEAYVVGNRWFYFSPKGIEIQGGVKGSFINNLGGESSYFEAGTPPSWFYKQDMQRTEGWAKIGRVNPSKKWQSMGLQLSGVYHNQKSLYNTTNYDAQQTSFYANYIYQSIIDNTNHIIKMGASMNYDKIDEVFLAKQYNRTEIVPGAFAEYSYNYLTKLNVVAGLRADYHNLYGLFVTPRLHLRYAPNDFNAIRASIGRAQRTANIFAENFAHMASNRAFSILPGSNVDNPYGLDPEIAWNMGLNYTNKFKLGFREGTFTTDYYYTHFQNQVVVDIENPTQVRFYNLNGQSFAHSFQAQVDYALTPRLDVRMAYRYYDVKSTYTNSGLIDKPLIAKHRGFANLGYATRNNWKFDYTFQIFGPKRLPMHSVNGNDIIQSDYTRPFTVMNAQISKVFKEDVFEVYAGVENILGQMQNNLILMSENTSSPYFDASLIWGQAMGRNIYIGFRYNIPKK